MYCLKLETLGFETTSIILSCAALEFNHETNSDYHELYKKTLFIKFSIEEQLNLGRISNPDTIKYWQTQSMEIQEQNFLPGVDISVNDGIMLLRKFLKKSEPIFFRNADAYTLSSLTKSIHEQPLYYANNIFCTKTAIHSLKDEETFALEYVKHNPISTVCNDVINLIK